MKTKAHSGANCSQEDEGIFQIIFEMDLKLFPLNISVILDRFSSFFSQLEH
jgi:hypothetical protein